MPLAMIGIFLNSHVIWVTQSFRLNYVFNSINISLISQCINRKNFLNFIVLKHQTFIPARILREPLGWVCSVVWPWLPSACMTQCRISCQCRIRWSEWPLPMLSHGEPGEGRVKSWEDMETLTWTINMSAKSYFSWQWKSQSQGKGQW